MIKKSKLFQKNHLFKWLKLFSLIYTLKTFYYLFFKTLLKKIIIQDKINPINDPIEKKTYEEIVLILSDIAFSNMGL